MEHIATSSSASFNQKVFFIVGSSFGQESIMSLIDNQL